MSEATMALSDDQLQQIGEYVQSNLPAWLRTVPAQVPQATDPVLLERMVRVEGELKAQREIMIERFDAIDKRFEEQLAHSNTRFDAVDKRFEDVNKRFEDVNKRFDDVNERFEDVNKRFDDVNKRFEDMNKRFTHTQWLIGILVTMFMGLSTALQLL